FSLSNSPTLSANGFFSRRCGPRLFAVNPANSPRSRCLRQFVRLDQYKPSRRSSAPISPLCLQLSASRKTSSLYSAVNRRRSPLAKTSTSLENIASLLPVSIFHSLLALYTKLLAGKCLIHIGREGPVRADILPRSALTSGWSTPAAATSPCRRWSGTQWITQALLSMSRFRPMPAAPRSFALLLPEDCRSLPSQPLRKRRKRYGA